MSFRELLLVEWTCDGCGLVVLGDESRPACWAESYAGHHMCAICQLDTAATSNRLDFAGRL